MTVLSSSSMVQAFSFLHSGLQSTLYMFFLLIAPISSRVLIIRYTVAEPILSSFWEAL